MTIRPCSRESEIKALLNLGAWPHACPPELRAHVETCASCGDLVLITVAFKKARADAAAKATVGSSGALWWRAQLRRRNAAVERIGKPILGAQIFALSINLMLALGFVVSQARHGLGWLSWLERLPQARTLHLEVLWPAALFDSGWSLYLLIPALATLALVGGVVVYLAASEKQ
jgi:hypothetical protein